MQLLTVLERELEWIDLRQVLASDPLSFHIQARVCTQSIIMHIRLHRIVADGTVNGFRSRCSKCSKRICVGTYTGGVPHITVELLLLYHHLPQPHWQRRIVVELEGLRHTQLLSYHTRTPLPAGREGQ